MIGARTGQEVVALHEMGLENVIGIDIVPHEPLVVVGDMHNLEYEDNSFDFVHTNVLDHSIDPKKLISEVERVLRPGGIFFLQVQVGLNQDEFTEFVIHNPVYDVVTLFDQSYCLLMRPLPGGTNFAAMNFEFVFIKDQDLSDIFHKYGTLDTLDVPQVYQDVWDVVNLETQTKKLDTANILDPARREKILTTLSKRAYYLTRFAEQHKVKNIAEVGTAQGWQFFSFAEYATEHQGSVTTCDIRDVRNDAYKDKFKEHDNVTFVNGTSDNMAPTLKDVDMYYIDGSHDRGAVLKDVAALAGTQTADPLWVFDDFDVRFGCYEDIATLIAAGSPFKVYAVGETASGSPSHQVLVRGKYSISAKE
jgi:ubiquinone/menaquinone biosynthesis C-methylase UbiE